MTVAYGSINYIIYNLSSIKSRENMRKMRIRWRHMYLISYQNNINLCEYLAMSTSKKTYRDLNI